MNPLLGLTEYLGKLEKNLRMFAVSRGVAAIGIAALVFTVLLVVAVNWLSFSDPSVFWARVALFLILGAAISAALVIPLLRLNRRAAARKAEQRFPQFGERLLTFTERSETNAADPFLPLLALDALDVAKQSDASQVVRRGRIVSFASAGAAAVLVLIWLGVSGPGFLGYGTSLLWGGLPKEDRKPFYSVRVEPGNKIIRRRSDQVVVARLSGFLSPKVNLMARYGSSTKWEQAPMQPQPSGSGYEFLLVGVPENVDYYVEAGGVRSNTYKLSVMDLPVVKNVRVTYHYPSWLGMKDGVEDPGGDLRAVEGTVAEVEIQTDRPLANGSLTLDDGSKFELQATTGNKRVARVPIQKDGMYHVASLEQSELVRLSEDYFIEARKDSPPMVTLLRPARDAKVNPIEEVSIAVKGSDDFGLRDLEVRYSVNGSPEKTVSLLKSKGAKAADGSTTLYLEDYKLAPGDIVSLYATAQDARNTTKTDIYFIEAQPFEKEYSQSQQAGGGGGEGDDSDQRGISARQKEIIAATWNQLKDTSKNKTSAAENAKYLSDVQSKLRDQAQSLADRMKKRELAGNNPAFQAFVKDMEEAVAQMAPAAEKLKGLKWQDAMTPEQKALQYLLRAESTFRQIQVAFGKGSGAGGKAGAGRDLENLFDLELDTEKNQYESGQQSAAEKRQKEVDDALKKLEELARRQQQLAEQNRNQQQNSQQRWQQEMLRREAEQLRREMEQLARDNSSQQQQSQSSQQQSSQGQQSQGGQQGQSGQQSSQQQRQQQQQGQQGHAGQQQNQQQRQAGRMSPQQQQQIQQALERLSQATREMSSAASTQNSPQQGAQGKAQADAERAAERLKEAREMLAGMRKQQAGDEIDDIAANASRLAKQQEDFAERLRKNFGGEGSGQQASPQASPQTAEKMSQEKQQMINDLAKLEQEMQRAARDLANTQRAASAKLREGLGNMQQNELRTRMNWTAEALKRGLGSYAVMREAPVTQGLNELKEQVRQAQAALDRGQQPGQQGQEKLQQALTQAENLRQQIEQMARSGQRNGQGQQGRNQQGQNQQNGQQQGQGQQPGQQQGQQAGQQQGQQGGQQGQQGQQGGQQPGDQTGQQQGQGGSVGSNPAGGRTGVGSWNGLERGGAQPAGGPWGGRDVDPETAYRDALRDLGRLQQATKDNPDVGRDLQDLARQMQRIDPRRFPGNPELLEQIHSRILAQIEQVELVLRRKLDEQGGTVRSGAQQPPPPGYANAVAEYFRRLSKEH